MSRLRCTVTSSIMRFSMVNSPVASMESFSSSVLSSSAMKPMVPMFTPRRGTPLRVAALAMCRMVPSPPKQITSSALGSSLSSREKRRSFGSS